MSEHSPAPPSDLDDLQALSRRLGADLTLVQGSGGNTSIKDGEVLWVKASGTWLINAEEQEILVPIDLPRVEATLKAGGSDFNLPKLVQDLLRVMSFSWHFCLPSQCPVSDLSAGHV